MKFDTVLIDLSGTIHIEETLIPGSIEALKRLRDAGKKIKFVTNTTSEPLQILHAKLKNNLNLDLQRSEIFTSLTAARRYVEGAGLRPFLILDDGAMEDFEGLDTTAPNCVVVGLAPTKFDYAIINKAFNLLLNGAKLIAVHKGRYYQKKDGQLHLGPGPFVTALEYAASLEATVVGKPRAEFFLAALESLGSKPENSVMVGDDVRDDVVGAIKAGLSGILVQTGKYRANDENSAEIQATHTCADFKSAVDYILSR